MSISDNYQADISLGNGVTTVFTGTWTPLAASYMRVNLENIATGASTLQVLNTDYTLSFTSAGYTVTFITAPTSAYNVIRTREVALTQTDPYTTAKGFQGPNLENSLDKLTAISQDIKDDVGRSLKYQVGSTASTDFPEPEANKIIGWNAGASNLVNLTPNTGAYLSVSSFMETVLDDATAPAALTTLGVSAFAQTILDDADASAARTTLGIPFTAASSSGAASLVFAEDTDNGSNTITVIGAATISTNHTLTLPGITDTFVCKTTTDTLTNKTIATGGGNDVQAQFKVRSATYDVSTASGTQDITGFGFNPRGCDILMGQSAGGLFFSDGFTDGTTAGCRYQNNAALLQITDTGITVFAQSVIGTTQASGVVSFITDGIRITWTKVGSPTGTITMLIKGYR